MFIVLEDDSITHSVVSFPVFQDPYFFLSALCRHLIVQILSIIDFEQYLDLVLVTNHVSLLQSAQSHCSIPLSPLNIVAKPSGSQLTPTKMTPESEDNATNSATYIFNKPCDIRPLEHLKLSRTRLIFNGNHGLQQRRHAYWAGAILIVNASMIELDNLRDTDLQVAQVHINRRVTVSVPSGHPLVSHPLMCAAQTEVYIERILRYCPSHHRYRITP